MLRLALAVLVAVCGAVLVGLLSSGTGAVAVADDRAAGDPLLPDLVTRPPGEVYVSGNNLRFSNTVANRGVGPLEIFPEPTSGADCNHNGDPTDDRRAYQRVFHDSADPGSPGWFDYHVDTEFSDHLVGCMMFHPAHNHWHFDDFARYLLQNASGQIVARSVKVSFCVADGSRVFPNLKGSRTYEVYPFPGGVCSDSTTEGLSIGWADTYTAATQGQSVNISGLPTGDYCLISRADPHNVLQELKDTNNGRWTPIHLNATAGTVSVLPGVCPSKA